MKRERQLERDRRHEQRMKHGLGTDDVDHRYIKTVTNGNSHHHHLNHRRGSGGSAASGTSEGSEGSAFTSSPPVRRTTGKSSTSHSSSSRYQSSDDEQGVDYKYIPQGKQPEQRKGTVKGIILFVLPFDLQRIHSIH